MATETITRTGSNGTIELQKPSKDPSNILRDVEIEDFLKLMITELQNQDPLNPMDNDKILQQIGQMQSIQSSLDLRETLGSVLLGQNLSSAASMIGKVVQGLDDENNEVVGLVDRVSVEDGTPRLLSGENSIKLENVREIIGG